MSIKNFKLNDALLIESEVYADERGYFFESYNTNKFSKIVGKEITFVQENNSKSKKNVLRGLHYQLNPKAQGKLIKVISGDIYDVIVDIRRSSSTFLQWEGIKLSSIEKKQIWIPSGFAHGFLTLSDFAEVSYKVTEYYDPRSEAIIRYDDPKISIDWPKSSEYILSDKDKEGKLIEDNVLFE
jgi:dTDP-4-dehydrorhamnose 3,5-epimerase